MAPGTYRKLNAKIDGMKKYLVALMLFTVACGTAAGAGADLPDLPPITGAELDELLRDSGRPSVVNVWASWCPPCRSEAPLLREAHDQFGGSVDFIGVDVQDNQSDAKDFLAEFGIEFEQFFDRPRSVPNFYAAIGTPITFFFDSDGELIRTHLGVIDDRSLALGVDEIINR